MTAPRTSAEEAMRAVGRLREALHDLERCEFSTRSGRVPAVSTTLAGPTHHVIAINIVVHDPDDPAP